MRAPGSTPMILRKLGAGLLYVLLSPLIVAIVVIAAIVIGICRSYVWASLRWRCWRTGTWRYIVCSSRHGWNEFLINNLFAVLPPGITPIWSERESTAQFRSLITSGAGLAKPYLATVKGVGVRMRPLHTQLLPYKRFGRKDEQVQQVLRTVLESECEADS